MINNEEFTIRIREILTYYNLSAASFAEKMGVGRSSISHIISGRNKPSLEFVLHILKNFKEVTFDWLMYGKGSLQKVEDSSTLFSKPASQKKFDEKNTLLKNSKNSIDETVFNSITDKKKNIISNTSYHKTLNSIERIVIFYNDGTFKEYSN